VPMGELRLTAQRMTELISLIQQYPKEARRILKAVEDGLILGPAQIMPCATEAVELAKGIEGEGARAVPVDCCGDVASSH
jgi:hypothetical protein